MAPAACVPAQHTDCCALPQLEHRAIQRSALDTERFRNAIKMYPVDVFAGAGSCVDMWVRGTIRMDHVGSIYDR